MASGLQNVPCTFQRVMDVMPSAVKWHFALVYLHDIVVLSCFSAEQIDHLNTLTRRRGDREAEEMFLFHENDKQLGSHYSLRPLKNASLTTDVTKALKN